MDAEQLYLDAGNGLVNTVNAHQVTLDLYDEAALQLTQALDAIQAAIDYLYQTDWALLDEEQKDLLHTDAKLLSGAQSHLSILIARIRHE